MIVYRSCDRLRIAIDELNNAWRKPGLEQNLVHQVAGIYGHGGWFPDNHVAHQCRSGDEVAADRSEVEGRNCVHKSFKRSPVGSTVVSVRIDGRLLVVDLLREADIEAEKVCQLSSSVDLSLPRILALTEHGSRHELVAILSRDQLGCPEKDGGTISEGHVLPS